ncbi:MAG: AAA family ATPase [Gemmataceae bacterium]
MANHLRGIIQRVTFHNPETGYAVLRVEVPGMRDLATVVGKVVSVAAGEQIDTEGAWIRDPKHGEQFQASEIRCRPPSTLEGIEKYLGSGLIKGIGPTYARKIVEVFGERTLQVIEESPTFLKEIRGIGPQRIARIRESWRQQKTVRDIMVFLQSYGLGTQRAVRIYKTYGDNAVDLIRENPYRLATDIWGVGFQTADELASRLGVDPASPRRARAALLFTLRQLAREGHVGCPEDLLLEQAMRIPGLLLDVLQETGQKMASEGEIVVEPGSPPWWYLRPLFLAENGIAGRIVEQQTGPHPLNLADPDGVIDAIEQRMGLQLAAGQRDALRQAGRQKVLVLTGGPGTGKSTIVRGLVELFEASGLKVLLAAPTGRAAKRLGETTRRDARTIHRLLEFDPTSGGFKRTMSHPLETDLLVVDEVSMVDVPLMNHLLQAVPRHACLVLVGDQDQLPSVGPGSVLADLLAFEGVGVARLSKCNLYRYV